MKTMKKLNNAQLVKVLQDLIYNGHVLLWNEDTRSLDDTGIESVCINGQSIQLNLRPKRTLRRQKDHPNDTPDDYLSWHVLTDEEFEKEAISILKEASKSSPYPVWFPPSGLDRILAKKGLQVRHGSGDRPCCEALKRLAETGKIERHHSGRFFRLVVRNRGSRA